ncbi:hypothetical protein Trisim1_003724 [Trichoderma cf. simile WF8]
MSLTRIFVIGGTGAQGRAVIEGLTGEGKYQCCVLTRVLDSEPAKYLATLPGVELVKGSFTDERLLRSLYSTCDGAFVNIDGFNVGEKGETFWAIRAFELALESKTIKFFVYGNLDYTYKKSGYRPEFRTGHYDGKGRVGDWILSHSPSLKTFNSQENMKIALFTTGPYIDMMLSPGTVITPNIETDEAGEAVVTWRAPLGDGACPHVALDDCGHYVLWLFDNYNEADGMNLETSISHIRYEEFATAFNKVTGKKARFVDVDLDTWWKEGPFKHRQENAAGYGTDVSDPATMTLKQNFDGYWTTWRHSGGNIGVVQRDYALLDRIHPHRIRTVEEWFTLQDRKSREEGTGSLWERIQPAALKPLLKIQADQWKSPV